MKKLPRVLAVAALIMVFASLAQAQCCPPPECCQPCGLTPGFWKNHPEAWTAYSPDQLLTSVFANVPADLAGDTLMDALHYKGGPGDLGAARILLRAAVASLLNAAQLTTFCYDTCWVVGEVNAALGSIGTDCSRETMLSLAEMLDMFNQDCTGGDLT